MYILHFKYINMSTFESDESFQTIIDEVNKAGRRSSIRHSLVMGAKMAGISFLVATGLVLSADTELSALNQNTVGHIITYAGELGVACGFVLGTAETIYELADYKRTFESKNIDEDVG